MLLSLLDLVLILLSSSVVLSARIHSYATEPFLGVFLSLELLWCELPFGFSVEGFIAIGSSSYIITLFHPALNCESEDGV